MEIARPPYTTEIDPRSRIFLLAVRRALLIAVDAINEYLGLPSRAKVA